MKKGEYVLQFKSHKDIYLTLHDNVNKISSALSDDNYERLDLLFEEQTKLLDLLISYGDSLDSDLKKIVTKILKKIDKIVTETEEQKKIIIQELNAVGNKKKVSSAYGNG